MSIPSVKLFAEYRWASFRVDPGQKTILAINQAYDRAQGTID